MDRGAWQATAHEVTKQSDTTGHSTQNIFDPEMKIGITVLLKDIWSKQKATKMNYMTSSLYTEQFNLQHFKLHYFKSVLHFYPHYSVVKNIRRNRFFPGR